MKYTLPITLMLFVFIASCEKDNKETLPDIKIGQESQSLTEVSVNKQTTRYVLLSGGNEKFSVSVENSKIAQASIHLDTLKIKGLFEGETFATIISHDKKARLGINIVPPDLSLSQNEILLRPNQESKFVSLNGGHEVVELKIDDPDNLLEVNWNGNTKILEMRARYEGEATVTALSDGFAPQVLKVRAQCDGDIKAYGYYDNSQRYLSQQLAPRMLVKRKGVGILMGDGTNPYGETQIRTTQRAFMVPFMQNPKQGTHIDVEIQAFPNVRDFSNLKSVNNRLYVEEVRDTCVILRGRGFKIVVPKE